jgi:hypothetical protein
VVLAVLVATIFLEWGIYALFLRRRLFFLFGTSILVNGLTNPSANLLYSSFPNLWLVELLVIASEILLLRWLIPLNWRRAVILSLAANLVSSAAGLLIFS